MSEIPQLNWQVIFYTVLALVGVGAALSLVLFFWVWLRIKRIQLPPDAGMLTALRATPLSIVILLDLLDLGLDFLSAPFAWAILGHFGLLPLRAVTLAAALIPGTQFLPTMTGAWLIARLIHRS